MLAGEVLRTSAKVSGCGLQLSDRGRLLERTSNCFIAMAAANRRGKCLFQVSKMQRLFSVIHNEDVTRPTCYITASHQQLL